MRGGGIGGVLNFAPSPLAGTVANPLAYNVGSSCVVPTDPRFGTISSSASVGIPGVQGSGRGTLTGGSRRRGRKGQRGGAYGFANDGTVGGFPGSAGLGGITNIGPSAPSLSQIPPSHASGNLNSRDSPLWNSQSGGAMSLVGSEIADAGAPLTSGTTSMDAKFISVPTAGITHLNGPASIGTSSAGVPYMHNVAVDGRTSAYAHKGGRRSRRGKKSKKSKKSRKSKSRR